MGATQKVKLSKSEAYSLIEEYFRVVSYRVFSIVV